jgi:hypothetical protein
MKQLLAILLITIASFSVAHSQQRQPQKSRLIEQFSFSIPSFEMNHQGETNKLNISISYRYAMSITSEFEVAPSRLVPYTRSSRVTRSRLPVSRKKLP